MLDFLSTVTIEDVAEVKVGRSGGPRKQRNPENGLAIRVWRDGSVYPSADLAAKFNLEYGPRVMKDDKALPSTGNGFDVIDTQLYPSFKVGQRILIISPVAKALAKVDLFGSTGYNEDGTPKVSVMEQGSKTFGADELIPMLEEIYGIVFFKPAVAPKAAIPASEGVEGKPAVEASLEVPGAEFVDMLLVANPATGEPWGLPTGKDVTHIPKKISRGKDAGIISTVRRELPLFYAFLPESMVNANRGSDRQPAVENNPTELQVTSEPVAEFSTLQEARDFVKEAD